jgi:hypothetical protein
MNTEHLKLVKHLIPLVWKPGFMGSFLGRFLLDDELVNTPDENKRKFLGHNHEWVFNDRLATYLCFNENTVNTKYFKKYTDHLKKSYTGTELYLATWYFMAKLTQDDYKNYKLAPNEITVGWDCLPDISTEKIDELVNSSFDYDNFYQPYIKTHINNNINLINSLEWKNKMYCTFPKEKAWIPALLHLYKIYVYKKSYTEKEVINKEHINRFLMFKHITASPTNWNLNYVDESFIKEDYTKIDMYDLIFNKNANRLAIIDSKFLNPLSASRLELLNMVQAHIEFICNDFFKIPVSYNLEVSKTNIDSRLVEIYNQYIVRPGSV